MDFFTSDTHMGHANIIKYCNRPFANVDEMNETLIKNINEKVKENDTLYHLGDFAMGGKNNAKKFREQINCKNIILIFGNHDHPKDKDFCSLFSRTYDMYTYKGYGNHIVLCHYSLKTWNNAHHGWYSLYGHSHNTLPDDPHSLSFDIGVDCHNYKPLSIKDVEEVMRNTKTYYKPVDHHNSRTT